MARVKQSVIEHNALVLLEYLESRAVGVRRVAIVSLRDMSNDLAMSRSRVRHLVRLLSERGYIEVRHCFARDGGEQPNAHRITAGGKAALKAYVDQSQNRDAYSDGSETVALA